MRLSTKCVALAGLAMLTSGPRAIELFEARVVPGLGFSVRVVSGWWYDAGPTSLLVGSVDDSSGRSMPSAWDLDNDGQFSEAQLLPILPFLEGEAVAGATFPNGDQVIVGNVSPLGNPADVHAMIWRRAAGGDWGVPLPLTDNNSNSRINRADYCGNGAARFGAVGAVMNVNGIWRPAFFDISMTDVDPMLLQAPPGVDAMALGIQGEDGAIAHWAVVGFIEDAMGRPRPVEWDIDNDGTYDFIQVPSSTFGVGVDAWYYDFGYGVVGTLSRNGTMRGFTTTYPSIGTSDFILLPPLEGYDDSSAASVLSSGGSGTDEQILIGGRSILPYLETATIWINQDPVPAQQFLMDPGSVPSLASWGWDLDNDGVTDNNNPALGIVRYEWDFDYNGSALVLPTEFHAPDKMSLMMGRFRNGGSYPDLWHDDGQEAVVLTERMGNERMAEIELYYTPLNGNSDATLGTFMLDARLISNGPAAGTLMVHVYNYQQAMFEEIATVRVTDNNVPAQYDLPGLASTYRDPQTGQMHVCLEFVQDGNRPVALAIDTGLWWLR